MPLPRHHPRRISRLGLRLLLAAVIGSGLVPLLQPAMAAADTAQTMDGDVLGWINQSRAAIGLVPLRSSPALANLAGYRAGVMASTGTLSHTVAGCLSCELTSNGIQWYGEGEVLGENTYPWGVQSAKAQFDWWMSSSEHRPLLMSSSFNYIGIGFAYRSADASTWSSIVFTESVDHTPPWAAMRFGSATGTTVSWGWKGGDVPLQTHAAGLENFDVEYRIDGGTWSTIRSGTTATALSLGGRSPGHAYWVRVRSRDWRGNLSDWTAALKVWLPPNGSVAIAGQTASPNPSPPGPSPGLSGPSPSSSALGSPPSDAGSPAASPPGTESEVDSTAATGSPGLALSGTTTSAGSAGGEGAWVGLALLVLVLAVGAGFRWRAAAQRRSAPTAGPDVTRR